MSSFRNATRLLCATFALALPLAASAATFEVKAFIDSDNNRSTGCTLGTPAGIVSGIEYVVTTTGNVTPTAGAVTSVTRQTCAGSTLSAPVAVDGGWNVGVNAIGDLTIETRLGADIMTMDNVLTPRFAFSTNVNGGIFSDGMVTPFSWGGGDIVMPHAARDHAVATRPLRTIVLDGNSPDWDGEVPVANGTDHSPAWRFIGVQVYAGAHDLYFNFQIHTNSLAPTAHDDTYALPAIGGTLSVSTLGVLNNDNPNNQPITATLVSNPHHGTVTLNPNGGFTYVHDGSLVQQDQFTYVATGTPLLSNVATVTISMPSNNNSNPYVFTSPDHVTFTAGQFNTFQVTVTGKPTPALTEDGTLPSGITLTDNGDGTGTLSGVPGACTVGVYPIVIHADKNKPHQTDQNFTLTVSCPNIAITNPAISTGSAGTPFSQTFTQAGGCAPVTFSESGALPTGLTFNTTTGVLSGTPTQAGTFPITVTATDSNGCSGTGSVYNLVITCPGILVTNPATNTGTVNVAFSQTFTQSGAIGGATFSLNSGTLPAGLTLSAAGVLSGTPTQSGSFPITVKVTAGNGCTGVGPTYNLTINCQTITVTNPATNTGTANSPFSQTFTASNTIGTVTFSTASTLPAGLTLSSAGVLSGTPTQTGSFPIVVKATDANGCFGNGATYTLTINCQVITVTNPATTTGTVSAAFSQTFTQSGGIGTMTFSLNSGTLPTGLTLSSAGVLSGTPTQTGSFPITVKVTDSNNCTGTGATYTLVIGCQTITVTNPATTTGTVSTPFSQTFTQTGAVGGATFSLNSGSLPAGLTLSSAGVLSGTPTVNGSFPITVKVTDGNNCTGIGATYTLVISCQTITVTNPATTTGTAGTAFSQTFTQSGAVGGATFSLGSGSLPAGLTLSSAGLLSGTPTVVGSFPITVTVTDGNGCTGTGSTYPLVISCQTITVTNPLTSTGVAGAAFSQTFTQSGSIGGSTFTLGSGTLPTGLSLSTAGLLSGTPTQTGSFPITVTVTDGNGCTGTGPTYTLTITCQTITVTNPATTTGTAGTPFSQTFTQSGAIGGATFTLNSGSLPAGLTLSSAGLLSGTPTVVGSFPITVKVTDGNGCTGVGATYTLVISCQTITVTNPATTTGTVNSPFSQTFTQSGAIGGATFTLNSGSLPAGLSLSTAGVLSGTPTVNGSFTITVKVTDGNGCTGVSASYPLVINCQTITVTNPGVNTGTVGVAFSQTFTQTGAQGTATFTTASTLPTGFTLSTAGVLSGTTNQHNSFPIVVTVTDGNGCTGTSATYTLIISCQTITVTNPSSSSIAAGTPLPPANFTFTQSGSIGTATFTTASTLPTGVSLTSAGVLTGTPTQGGSFPIVVTVTDGNGCTGTNPSYTLTITCPTITVTNPGVSTGTVDAAFSQTFTQSGGTPTVNFTLNSGSLPAGLTLATSGVLSGTPTVPGTFPITVVATDANGCTGVGATYTLVISCQTITVTNPATTTGTVDAPFSQTFTQSGVGTHTPATFTLNSGSLPAGLSLSTAGVLSGTPTVPGSFPITVKVTDANNCTGISATYTLVIACQTITVTNPVTTTGTVDAPFSQTFTQSGVGTHTPATFTINSGSLPAGLSLSTAGVLSGTPLVQGSFPITVKVTDANNCTGISSTYSLVINCQTITVTNPATTTGTAGVAFSQTFTQSGVGTHTPATFTTASTLPTGFTLSTSGVLSGTTTQHGTFPIVVTVTDANGCTGTGSTYSLVIACNTITVTNPVNTAGTVGVPFSETFTSSGTLISASYTTASTLPTGLTLHAATGVLDGTPTQSGLFNIVVTVTDGNGCTGTGATYPLNIACNVITVTNPGVNTGTAGVVFNQTFTQTGGNGTITWSETGSLPSGITLNSSTGALFGTTSQTGSFPITVKATDGNGCFGTSSYTLTINCQTITVTNPGQTSVQAGVALDVVFTATGILGTATWTETGTLPTGITLNSSSGHLAGTTNQVGSFPITVTATDTNGCFGSSSYTLTVTCPTITVTRNGGGSFPAGIFNTAYTGQSVVASGGSGSYTYAVTLGALPTGLSLSGAGAISGTPTATGNFTFTVTATDTASSCTGSQSFSIAIAPSAVNDSYGAGNNIIDNVQFVITGGATASPATPFVGATGNILTNDLPSGGVTATPVAGAATTGGGTVTIVADGTFIYTPGVHAAAITSDSFTYTVVSNGVTSAPATVSLTLANRVWFVKNSGGAGDGRSHLPFNTLAAAQTASAAGDIIFVYNGNNTTSGQNAGITLKNNQQLIGEGVALVVNTVTLVPAGTKPLISNTAGSAVTLANGNTLKGLNVTGPSGNGIDGTNTAGLTMDTMTIQGAGAASSGLVLSTPTGTVTITNTAISNSPFGLTINGGTAAFTMNNTNTISSNAGQRTINFSNLGATAVVTIGAGITDNGAGIQVSSSVSGAQVSFTGTQTMTTTTNTAVSLTTNTGAIITFSGTLAITTTTGSGFTASGGGTLNVTGTADITTGAAASGLNLSGMTLTASGVTFNTVTTTGATTGVALTTLTGGTVTINGGTITNGTTGISLQGPATNLSLAGNTITGPTTGITNTTNFGTLTIGSSVNVSGVTALNLTTGALNGTFANLSSTGGTNGVVLTSIGGTGWTATAGSLAGATSAAFKVDGGSAAMTYGGSINASGFLVDIGATTGRAGGTITFSGALGATAPGTGIRIQNSTGTSTFTFSGTQTLGTSGTRMAATAVTLNANNTNTSFNFSGTLSIFTTGVTAFTATGPTGGTITFSGTDSIDAATGQGLVLNGMALGAGTLTGVTSTGGVNGIALTTVTGGTLTISGGSLSGNTGAAFLINGGTASVSYAGSITQNTAGQRAVDIQNATAGAKTLSGAIGSSGGAGVFLNSNTGATISISGNMTLSTGGTAAFTATGGGTVNVTGATNNVTTTSGKGINWSTDTSASTVTFNNVTSTTGDAVTVASSGATNFTMNDIQSTTGTAVTITTATGDFSFHKINANGGSKGISVTSLTGGGSFTVTGTGGSGLCDATHIGASDCAGGTIQNISVRGAEFTTAAQISLTNMYFKSAATTLGLTAGCKSAVATGTTTCNAPIYMNGSTSGATLNRIFIDGSVQMGIAATGVAGMTLTNTEIQNTTSAANQAAVTLINNTGTFGITSLNLHNNDNGGTGMLFVENDSGTMTLNVTSSTFNKGTSLSGGINAASYSTATMTVNVQTSTFGDAVAGNGLFSNGVTIGQSGTSMNVTINGSSFTNTNGISIAGTSGALTYAVTNNTPIQNKTNGSNGITVGKTAGSGTANGSVTGNNITKATCGGGCAGIRINAFGAGGTTTQTISNNTIAGVDADGMIFAIGQGATNSTFTIQGNNISPQAGTDGFAINAVSGTTTGDNPCSVFTIGGAGALANTVSGTWFSVSGPPNYRINLDETLGNIKINGYVSGGIENFISGNNPSIPAAQILLQGAVSGGSTCP